MKPVVWTIAGTDPGGGAGIQADLKTFHGLGVHGGSIITAVIAQSSLGVRRVEFVAADLVTAQLEALLEERPPAAIKIGMLGSAAAAHATAHFLGKQKDQAARPHSVVVYDPVMGSSSGHELMSGPLPEVIRTELLPLLDVCTPNIPEAERLTGLSIQNEEDLLQAARKLRALGAKAVLLKGGHGPRQDFSQDLWLAGERPEWLTSPRRAASHSHGTGCTLSSALAAFLALGHSPLESAVLAKAYVNQGLRLGGPVGRGPGILEHAGWPDHPEDVPWLTASAEAGRSRGIFPAEGPDPIGLYPIVPRAAWLERLLPLGVRVIQLRAKDLDGEALDCEVAAAVEISRRFNAHLYINDRGDLARRHGAWGTHLGQEDLPGADLAALARAGLRVGISARSFEDIARARAVRPSYIGLGAVYATGSKDIAYAPLGVEGFARLRRWLEVPAVAIGGITLENAGPLLEAGADGLAVISDLVNHPKPEQRVHEWQRALAHRRPTRP